VEHQQHLLPVVSEVWCWYRSMASNGQTDSSTSITEPVFFLKNYSFIHMCIHCLGHFCLLPSSATVSPLSPPPQFQAGPVLPFSLILLKKRHKTNKEDKAFLLVELRIAIQKYSWHCFHVHMCYDPC
jgi:hypothetical protein